MTLSDMSSVRARTTIGPGHALAAAGAVMPTLAVFAYKGLAPLFLIVAAVELGLFWRERRRLPAAPLGMALLFAAFVLWGIIGAAWSLDAAASLATSGKLALMAALGLPLVQAARELEPGRRHLVLCAARAGVVAGIAFMAIELAFHLPITRVAYAALHIPHTIYPGMLDPAATVLVLAAAVVAGDLLARRHYVWTLIIGAAAIVLAVRSDSMAAGLAGVLAALVLVVVYAGGATAGRALAVIAAVLILVAPLLPSRVLGPAKEYHWPPDAVPSVYQRIAIWTFTEMRIGEHPVRGWGLDAARRIPGGHDGIKAESLHVQDPVMRQRVTTYFNSGNIEQMPLHPHNAALQIWLEAGGIGAALAAVFVLGALLAIARQGPASRPGAAAAFAFAMAALAIAGISYGIWQTWWLATLWFGAVFAGLICRPALFHDERRNGLLKAGLSATSL